MFYRCFAPLVFVYPESVGTWAEWTTATIALLALIAAGVSAYFSFTASKAARSQADAAEKTLIADAVVRAEAQPRQVYAVYESREVHEAGENHGQHEDDEYIEDGRLPSGEQVRVWNYVRDTSLYAPGTTDSALLTDVVEARFVVHNNSAEVIGPIKASIIEPYSGNRSAEGYFPSPILPEGKGWFAVTMPLPEGTDLEWASKSSNLPLVPNIVFRDAAGHWWERYGHDPIIRRDDLDVHDLP